mmetsp:Transcript_10650/g.13928  ORF Transcript_10650/g.13928 Transcript_10650/m.13928 type:complete len:114 (-) Transcript_10650:549-890(-)
MFNISVYLYIYRWVDMLDDEEVIYKRVQYLKDRHWLDRDTKYVTIEFLVYNGQVEPLVTKIELTFDFTRDHDKIVYISLSDNITLYMPSLLILFYFLFFLIFVEIFANLSISL